jgi:hypothetical protein
MTNKILAILAGVAIGVIVVVIGDILLHQGYPIPAHFDMNNEYDVKRAMNLMPAIAFVLMLFYWLLSAFMAGLVAGRIAKQGWQMPTIFSGIVLLLAAVLNMLYIPHPIWMVVLAVVFYIPAAFYGGKIMNPKKKKQKK